MNVSSVIGELRGRHARSEQVSSKTLVATIDAIQEALEVSSLGGSVLAYTGACMSALERPETLDDLSSAAALCTLLATVMQHVPATYMGSKFTTMSSVLVNALEEFTAQDAPACRRAVLPCLVRVLYGAAGTSSWATVQPVFARLLNACIDSNAKFRKLATEGLAEVLAAFAGTRLQVQASNEVLALVKLVVPAPGLAAKRAAASSQAKRADAEAVIVSAVQDCLRLMAALKVVLPTLAESTALEVAESLLGLFPLSQALLSRGAAECLTRLAQGSANTENVSAPKLASLLKRVLPQLDANHDVDTLSQLISFCEEALRALARRGGHGGTSVAASIGAVFARLAPLVAAESDGVRRSAADALIATLRSCVTKDMVEAATADAEASAGSAAPAGLPRAVVAVTALLGAGYQTAWPMAVPVVGEMLCALGASGAPLTRTTVEGLAELCRGASDAAEHASAAQKAMGAAIAAQGPAAVLGAVPLDVRDMSTCDTWLVPLLRKYTTGTRIAFWAEYMLPRAVEVGGMATRAQEAGRGQDHLKLYAFEVQLWGCLPSFANWATDVPTAMAQHGNALGSALQRRADLQAPICHMLRRVCLQASAVLRAHDDPDGVAHGVARGEAGDLGGSDDGMVSEAASTVAAASAAAGDHEDEPPDWVTHAWAEANRACMRALAPRWLTELLNRFVTLAPAQRGLVGDTIEALAALAGEGAVTAFYKQCLQKVITGMNSPQGPAECGGEGGAQAAAPDVTTFLDLAVHLAPGLPDASLLPLLRTARLVAALPSAALQKKGYRALAYIATARPALLRAHAADFAATLVTGPSVAAAAARRHRLAVMLPLVLCLLGPEAPDVTAVELPSSVPLQAGDAGSHSAARALVSCLLAEVVLSTKEVNAKARGAAYALLVRLAHALHEAYPPSLVGGAAGSSAVGNGGLEELFTMVLAGLAAQTPRMISATVMALARLTFEFATELGGVAARLIPAACTLLHSKAREVIRSVLGFLKVVAMRVPADAVAAELPRILEGLLRWAEDSKNKFKLKVRRLVTRLCKRCGYEAVEAAWPDSDRKLLTAVRKDLSRRVRQRAARNAPGVDRADGAGRGVGANTVVSRARTARASEWGHTAIFDSDEDDEGGGSGGHGTTATRGGAAASSAPTASRGRSGVSSERGRQPRRGTLAEDEDNPVDLLNPATARALVRTAAGAGDEGAVESFEFERNALGQLIIREDRDEGDPFAERRRRKRPAQGEDSDDADMEDIREMVGGKLALRKAGSAASLRHASAYAHSQKTAVTRRSKAASAATAAPRGKAADAAARFKAKRAGGDVKGASQVEPFAYWRFDKQLLNSRHGKRRRAQEQVEGVVGKAGGRIAAGKKAKKGGKKQQSVSDGK